MESRDDGEEEEEEDGEEVSWYRKEYKEDTPSVTGRPPCHLNQRHGVNSVWLTNIKWGWKMYLSHFILQITPKDIPKTVKKPKSEYNSNRVKRYTITIYENPS